MRPSAVLQHIQHIASLGLADRAAVPEILATLTKAVPAAYPSFFWIDRQGNTIDLHAPSDVLAAMAACNVDFLSLEHANEPTLEKVLAGGRMLDNAALMARRYDFSRSVVVNEVMVEMRAAMGLDLVIRRDGDPRAILYLNREVRAPEFTAAERRLLAAAHPYIAHALGTERDGRADCLADPEAEREGVVTVTTSGEIVECAGDGSVLLAEIAATRGPRRCSAMSTGGAIPAVLRPLLTALTETAAGRPAPPARLTLALPRGEYRARAYPLAGAGLVTLLVGHHLPREVRMLRRVAALPLAPVERRVAYGVGEGRAPASIARQLGLTEGTLRSYLKSIYVRTGVEGREGLAAAVRGSTPFSLH